MSNHNPTSDSLISVLIRVIQRVAVFAILFLLCNWAYQRTLYPSERYKFSKVAGKLDSALGSSDVVYLGESSNTSFNPWTDTLGYSVSEWLQYYFDSQVVVKGVSHDGYHIGMFRKMLGLLPEKGKNGKQPTVIVTVNMRSFGPAATFNPNEASNQQEAVFYSRRLPLLNRIYVSLHHYDNRNSLEMEREKFRWWRTHSIQKAPHVLSTEKSARVFKGMDEFPTTKSWFAAMSQRHYEMPQEIRNMADAYIKEFGWVMDDDNPRLLDLKAMVDECSLKKVNLVLLLLVPNRAHADSLFGETLTQYIDYNLDFLRDRISTWQKEKEQEMGDCATDYSSLVLVDIPKLYLENFGSFPSSSHYTDQFFPTEHVDAHVRGFISAQLAWAMRNLHPTKPKLNGYGANFGLLNGKDTIPLLIPNKNNSLNPDLEMPTSDSMMHLWRNKREN